MRPRLLTQKEVNPKQEKEARRVTAYAVAGTSFVSVVLPVVALLSYSAKEGGIQQNVLTMIPSREPAAVVVNLMMYLSVLLSSPIYGPPVNEVLEAGSECEGER